MDGVNIPYNPRTVEEVFRDFKGRRTALVKALSTDVDEFFRQCDPDKENLCLYGSPSEQWEVNLPAEEVPPEIPEPALGINFARDGMLEKDWLSLVAVHSDAWLMSVAFYFGARFGFNKADRKKLFDMINDLPTIFETITGVVKKQGKEKSSSVSNNSSTKSKVNPTQDSEPQANFSKPMAMQMQSKENDEANFSKPMAMQMQSKENDEANFSKPMAMQMQPKENDEAKFSKPMAMQMQSKENDEDGCLGMDEEDEEDEEDVEDDEEQGVTLCGACGESYTTKHFWICCDICDMWFHGKCVKITPARAEHINKYKCPSCSNKRARPSSLI
ncbi:unnamed protein product [Lathyrus sativus]|nr:unnamed protein product [Lathyrus sativus]